MFGLSYANLIQHLLSVRWADRAKMLVAHLPSHITLCRTVDARYCLVVPIFGEDNPISFVQCLRRVLDGESDPQTAHTDYQKNLRTQTS